MIANSSVVLARVEHHVVTNCIAVRLLAATLVMPKMECRIGLKPETVDEAKNLAKYWEFMEAYHTADDSRERVLESVKIHHYLYFYELGLPVASPPEL